MRQLGIALVLVLLVTGLGLRHSAQTRAERLLEGEQRSLLVLVQLQRAALRALRHGERPDLVSVARDAGLEEQLSTVAVPDVDARYFLQDRDSLYGLGYVRRRGEDGGPPSDGFVLRSWPRQHGVTGDLERHLDERSLLWEGQNTVARSGTERGFPPPFPEPDLDDTGGRWWRRPYAEGLPPGDAAGQR